MLFVIEMCFLVREKEMSRNKNIEYRITLPREYWTKKVRIYYIENKVWFLISQPRVSFSLINSDWIEYLSDSVGNHSTAFATYLDMKWGRSSSLLQLLLVAAYPHSAQLHSLCAFFKICRWQEWWRCCRLLSHQYQCKLSCLYCAHTHHMIFVSICCSCHMKQQKKVAHFSHDSRLTNYLNRFTNNLSNFSYDNHSIEGKYQLILSSHKCANQILWFFQPKHIELNLSIKNKAQKTKFFSMLLSFAVWRDKKTREKKVWKVTSVE